MHVAVVNQHPSVALGGSETQCALLSTELLRSGHEVTYVAIGGARGTHPQGLRVVDATSDAAELAAHLLAAQPDLVYWRFGTRHLMGVLRRLRGSGVPVILASSHRDDLVRWATPPSARRPGPLRLLESARDRVRSALDHRALRRVDGIVVNNGAHLDLVRHRAVVHIPNSVGPDVVPRVRPRPYVVWVSNLKPSKRPEACIPLAAAIADLDVDVVMVGRPQVAAYERFGTGADLPPNLHFLGPLPPAEAEAVLAGGTVHIHTCRPEGFPNVFLQAWRAGVPSVSLGFDPDGVIEREGLGACAGDDPRRFHAEVRRLLSDGRARSAAGMRARAYVAATADVTRNSSALVAYARDVLGVAV